MPMRAAIETDVATVRHGAPSFVFTPAAHETGRDLPGRFAQTAATPLLPRGPHGRSASRANEVRVDEEAGSWW